MTVRIAGMFIALLGFALLTGCSKTEEPSAAGAQPTAAEATQAGVGGESGSKPAAPSFDPSK